MDRVERNVRGVKEGVSIEDVSVERLLPAELRGVIEEMAIRYQKVPVEPRLDKETAAVIPEEEGVIIDVENTLAKIQAALPGEKLKLEIIKCKPRYTRQDLLNARNVVAGYQTYFHGSPARYQNIATALKSLNNTVIWPGEIFSMNDATGPRTAERGYLPAPIILNGAYDVDFGGGVCQVASTAYNAALQAKLPIVERHPHTKPVHYVPEGRDATVNYGHLDLKFRNNRNGPLIMKTGLQNGRIYVELRGEK